MVPPAVVPVEEAAVAAVEAAEEIEPEVVGRGKKEKEEEEAAEGEEEKEKEKEK